MPIQPLSDATSRILTSTQTLNNAVSVVKELIDNALDAHATSIAIEIAPNTLDKIIVKDDGFGIGVQDRQLLCKRGCTSKIVNLDDLAQLGGTYLGFRGTALASIAELSKEVTIVTKVEGEQPATTLTFGHSGKLLSSSSASHNIGTTVRVEQFLASIPVRKQVVLKTSSKILDNIKKLLQSYALARPAVKYSLKVLKAKDNRSNWSFAACKDDDRLLATAIQVVGKAVASLCELQSVKSTEIDREGFRIDALLLKAAGNDISQAGTVGQYFCVDGRPISSEKGSFKEIAKVYKQFLQHTAGSNATVPSKPFLVVNIYCPAGSYDINVEPAKDVVLFHNPVKVFELAERLFISSYGNMEPDDIKQDRSSTSRRKIQEPVLFNTLLARKPVGSSDGGNIVRALEKDSSKGPNPIFLENPVSNGASLIDNFAKAMRCPPSSLATIQLGSLTTPSPDIPNTSTRFSNTSGFDDVPDIRVVENPESIGTLAEQQTEEDYDPRDTLMNNSFVRAKLHSVQRPKLLGSTSNQSRIDAMLDQNSSPITTNIQNAGRKPLGHNYHPPTPDKSPTSISAKLYQNPGPPLPRWPKQVHEDEDDESDCEPAAVSVQSHSPQVQRSTLGNWVTTPTSHELLIPAALDINKACGQREQDSPSSTLGSQPGFVSSAPRNNVRLNNRPFKSPIKTPQVKEPHMFRSGGTNALGSRQQQSIGNGRASGDITDVDDDLQHILVFEKQKKAINQQLRQNQAALNPVDLARIQNGSAVDAMLARSPSILNKASSIGDNLSALLERDSTVLNIDPKSEIATSHLQSSSQRSSNPHQSRYLAAVQSLKRRGEEHESGDRVVPARLPHNNLLDDLETPHSFSPDDPRAYLISFSRSQSRADKANLRIARVKTRRLPLEIIPTEVKKHDLLASSHKAFPSIEPLAIASQSLASIDLYVKTGKTLSPNWSPFGRDVDHWQSVLQQLINGSYRTKQYGDEQEEVEAGRASPIAITLSMSLKAHLDSL